MAETTSAAGLDLAEFRDLASMIHRFRCTNPDCRHHDDEGYFTPRDNDAASATSYWLKCRAAGASQGAAEEGAGDE